MVAALLRACAVFLVAAHVAASVLREINDKGLELMLSLPLARSRAIPRPVSPVSPLCGALLAFFFALPLLCWAAPGGGRCCGASRSRSSCALVAAAALFFAMTLAQPGAGARRDRRPLSARRARWRASRRSPAGPLAETSRPRIGSRAGAVDARRAPPAALDARDAHRVAAVRHAGRGARMPPPSAGSLSTACCSSPRACSTSIGAAYERGRERPLAVGPVVDCALLARSRSARRSPGAPRSPALPGSADLPPAPRAEALRLASFGERRSAARLAMLYLQAFDYAAPIRSPTRRSTTAASIGWLRAILALDPRSDYPLFSAARVYAENPDPARSRLDAGVRLPRVPRAIRTGAGRGSRMPRSLAKHRLKDLPLARRYAAAIERYTTAPDVPLWARQMEIFILEDMNELEAARIMLGGTAGERRASRTRRRPLPQAAAEGAEARQRRQDLSESSTRLSKSRRLANLRLQLSHCFLEPLPWHSVLH